MEDKNITFTNENNLYEPDVIPDFIIDEETNPDWLFYKDVIDSLEEAKLITSNERFLMLLSIRKHLNLTVL